VFDIDRAIALGKKNKIFMPVRDTESNSYMYDVVYRVNKKKMKAWIKQNINRFLKTNKEIKREIEERNRQYYEDFCDNEV
jgi:transcription initiation factor IIE alpha subunit